MSQTGNPIEPYKISVDFKDNASYGPHEGKDFNLAGTSGNQDCGTPIQCIYPGEIVHTSNSNSDYGWLTVVECKVGDSKRWVRYCHMQSRALEGGLVNRGDIIGYMGSTGNSTACHLHLDVLKKKPSNWRYYTKRVDEWFEDPDILINAKIDDMPAYIDQVLKDNLGIDVNSTEGDFRGQVGSVKDKLNAYNGQESRIRQLQKELEGATGEAAENESRLRACESSRAEDQKTIDQKSKEVNQAQKERDDASRLLEKYQGMVHIPQEEYDRLNNTKILDRFTGRTLFWESIRRIFQRG